MVNAIQSDWVVMDSINKDWLKLSLGCSVLATWSLIDYSSFKFPVLQSWMFILFGCLALSLHLTWSAKQI